MKEIDIEVVKAIIEEVKQEAKNGWGIAPYDWGIIEDILHTVTYRLEKQEKEQPLTEKQKKHIKLFLGDGYGTCTDGYLMTKLGIYEWDEAKKLIAQYKREEGKKE